jgi:hypothetical protein
LGTADETFTSPDEVPAPYRRAADTTGTLLDRDATDQLAQVKMTFFGRATGDEGIDCDWSALTPFVGIDVWSPCRDKLLPPDTATTAFERLGLPRLLEPRRTCKLPTPISASTRSPQGFRPRSGVRVSLPPC